MLRPILLRALAFTLLACLGLTATERVVEYGASHTYARAMGKVNLVMQHRVDADLVVFGASNARSDFDVPVLEEALGESVYDLGMDYTPFVQYQALVREFAGSSPRCKDVVLAEATFTFKSLDAIRDAPAYLAYLSSPTMYEVLHDIDPVFAWNARYVPFYAFMAYDQSRYRAAAAGYLSLLGRPPPDPELKGFAPRDETFHMPPPEQTAAERVSYTRDERVLRQYRETLALLVRAGKRVTVVMTPILVACHPDLPFLDDHRARLRSLAREAGAFLDYTSHPVSFDVENFYNCSHLNRHGAEVFSRILAADLVALRR